MNTQEQNIAEKKLINLTIFSPVNVSVYYNTKSTLLMSIDLNTGINNDTKEIMSEDNFKLIFVTHGFEKSINFIAKPADFQARYEFNLADMLTQEEIVSSYDREAAIYYINIEPNGYAFEQMQSVAEEGDIELLHNKLIELSAIEESDAHNDYLIACCAMALGKNAEKYNKPEEVDVIRSVYENYNSKETYGYIFEKFINENNEQ